MIQWMCLACGGGLDHDGADRLRCTAGHAYTRQGGIWRMLPGERAEYYAQFMREYETVRQSEGRGGVEAEFYRTLPYHDRDDWRIRAKSYETLLAHLPGGALNLLDLGAGNGWLSNRLASAKHCPIAVDLLVNDFDGLGAARHYATDFPRVQAEFDHLPFTPGQFDVVIFNGALHYSTDYERTLKEALRLLRPTGQIVIMDSPVYHDGGSGRQMVAEREAAFQQAYGFKSDALPNENYLTYERLDQMAATLSLCWQVHTPDYGWRWRLKPLRAKLRGHREPAKFHVIIGMRS